MTFESLQLNKPVQQLRGCPGRGQLLLEIFNWASLPTLLESASSMQDIRLGLSLLQRNVRFWEDKTIRIFPILSWQRGKTVQTDFISQTLTWRTMLIQQHWTTCVLQVHKLHISTSLLCEVQSRSRKWVDWVSIFHYRSIKITPIPGKLWLQPCSCS